jgi:two-component system, cell cycle sensor histidine kinase and response regulator CckA
MRDFNCKNVSNSVKSKYVHDSRVPWTNRNRHCQVLHMETQRDIITGDTPNQSIQSLLNENSRLRNTIAHLEKKLKTIPGTEGIEKAGAADLLRLSNFAIFAVESMSDGVFLLAQDAHILYVNRAACQQLGYTEQELLGLTVMDFNPAMTEELWKTMWSQTRNIKINAIETQHKAKDGRVFPVEILANYIEFNGEQFSCSFSRDISDRKEMETRIRQSEKMEAIGQLAGGIAHDFNNQLSGILGYAGLLKMELAQNPELKQYAEGIITAGQRSSGLTAQLLAFSRQGKYLSVPVDLHALIDETVQILSRSINKNIAITTRFDAPSAITVGDPTQLENAFLNLAINARDAMPSGGEIVFSTCLVTLDEAFREKNLFHILPGTYIRVCVSDTGAGMSDDVKKRLFEPFFTTKEQGKGTGMGLASVYGTLKNHKGALDVRSEEGKGTTFTLYLPLSDIAGTSDQPEKNTPEITNFSARVLVVDDEPLIRDSVKKILEKTGCEVVTAENGPAAIEFYKTSHKDVDVVILDLIMPQMGGKETFLKMRDINPGIAALIASGYSMEGEVHELIAEGARGFLQKPFDPKDMTESLSRIIRRGATQR